MTLLLTCRNESCGQQLELEERALQSRPECPACGGQLELHNGRRSARGAARPHSLRDLIAPPSSASPNRNPDRYIAFRCEHCQAISQARKERLGHPAICPKCRQATTIAALEAPSPRPHGEVTGNGKVAASASPERAPPKTAIPQRRPAASGPAAQPAAAAAELRAGEHSSLAPAVVAPLAVEQPPVPEPAAQPIPEMPCMAEAGPVDDGELRVVQEVQHPQEEAPQPSSAAQTAGAVEGAQRQEELARERQAAEEAAARRETLERERQAALEKARQEAEARERQAAEEAAARREALERKRQAALEKARQEAEVLERREAEERKRRETRQRAIDAAMQAACAALTEPQAAPVGICRRRFDVPLSEVLASPTGFKCLDEDISLDLYARNRYRLRATAGLLGSSSPEPRPRSASGAAVALGYEWHAKPAPKSKSDQAGAEHLLFSDLFWLNLPDDALAAVTRGAKLAYPQSLHTLDELAASSAREPLALILHAAAIVAHNQAICMECAYAAGYRVAPGVFWDEAFVRWQAALEHPDYWTCVERRAATLSLAIDCEALRSGLTWTILSLNGALAHAYARAEVDSACQRHLTCMARSRLSGVDPEDLVEEVSRSIYSH
jgi:ssDNA-binding Zn-finger/Zn-ribbon topoisomerase 1